MKKLLLLFFILSCVSYAQWSSPVSKTTNLQLKLYNDGALPGADSLNHDKVLIDNFAGATLDSLFAMRTRFLLQHNWNGSHQNGSITWDHLSTAAKSNIVQVSGSQIITGSKTFNAGSTIFRNIYPLDDNLYYLGAREDRFARVYATGIYTSNVYIFNSSRTDSASIILEDSTIKFEKNIELTRITQFNPETDGVGRIGEDGKQFSSVWADTVASDSTLRLMGKQGGTRFLTELVTPPIERVLSAASTSFDVTQCTFVQLISPDAVANLHSITFNSIGGATMLGQRITVMNMSNVNITLKHGTGTLRNIGSTDVVLGQYDSVEYILIDIGGSSYRWIMLNHSNI